MRGGRGSAGRFGLAVFSALALFNGGCSFLFVHGPPPDFHERRDFECTSDATAPAIDSAIGLVGGAMTLFLLALSGLSDTTDPRGRVALLSVPLVILPAGSAVYGFHGVRRCRVAKADLLARRSWDPSPAPAAAPASPASGSASPIAAWQASKVAVVGPAGGDVRSAPYLVAPVVVRLAPGQEVAVSATATDGWRVVLLPQGKVGYIEDTHVQLR